MTPPDLPESAGYWPAMGCWIVGEEYPGLSGQHAVASTEAISARYQADLFDTLTERA